MFDIFTLSDYPKNNRLPGAVTVQSLEEAHARSRTRFFWLLDFHNDYQTFDLLWEPVLWEASQKHVWPSQHQENGGTMLVPTHVENPEVNYHKQLVLRAQSLAICIIDHGNGYITGLPPLGKEVQASKTRFISDYLGTLKRIVRKEDSEYLWVLSSLCNYTPFNLTWHPSEWQNKMLHVFASNEQKFGDTFLINVAEFKKQMDKLELLEWYDTICFHEEDIIRRLRPSIFLHSCDTQVEAAKAILLEKIKDPNAFNEPVIAFTNTIEVEETEPTLNLWRPETRAIVPLSPGGSRVLVPREALSVISTQLYDYPNIDKSYRSTYTDKPLDIVFLSNGERCADEHYEHLCKTVTGNIIQRVTGVQGRLNAYRACANIATTTWFFVVYAKLKVDEDFGWHWQPDRMQQPKHYIFEAYNSITGDTYGHMAMIAFNKQLVLEHDGMGVDFSMHQEHAVVPLLSGEAEYANEPRTAWRTAFREVLKLQLDNSMESSYHLSKWQAATDEWTAKGVSDAIDYYDGTVECVRSSYEWEWLATHFRHLHA